MMRKTVVLTVIAMLAVVAPTWADSIVYYAEAGDLAAQAVFEVVGSTLTITLTNMADDVTPDRASVLTGVFFTTPWDLSRVDARLWHVDSDNKVVGDPWGQVLNATGSNTADGTNHGSVGSEWAYNEFGLASAGLTYETDGFGPTSFPQSDSFGGDDLYPPADGLNGVSYGLVSLETTQEDVEGNGWTQQQNKPLPLVHGSVVFTLTGVPNGFSVNDIEFYGFAYGSGPEHVIPPVPEPTTLVLLGVGVAGLLYRKRARVS